MANTPCSLTPKKPVAPAPIMKHAAASASTCSPLLHRGTENRYSNDRGCTGIHACVAPGKVVLTPPRAQALFLKLTSSYGLALGEECLFFPLLNNDTNGRGRSECGRNSCTGGFGTMSGGIARQGRPGGERQLIFLGFFRRNSMSHKGYLRRSTGRCK